MHNRVYRAAAIHDLSGFGRCSLAVIIPVLSAMGVQVCPVPVSYTHLSNTTRFCRSLFVWRYRYPEGRQRPVPNTPYAGGLIEEIEEERLP